MQKFGLKQVLSQRMTPQQIQFMGLLQATSRGLEDKVVKELSENPALEEEVATDAAIAKEASVTPEYPTPLSSYSSTNKRRFSTEELLNYRAVEDTSIEEILNKQIHLLSLDTVEAEIVTYMIGSLDSNGYLRKQLAVLVEELAIYYDIEATSQQVEGLLHKLQELEPAGIGARDLQECLLLQLKRKENTPTTKMAMEILMESFDFFSKRHYNKIAEKHKVSLQQIKEVPQLVLQLKPHPISSTDHKNERMGLVPDFVMVRKEGKLQVMLAKQKDFRLGIRKQYTELLAHHQGTTSKEGKEVVAFIQQNIQRAKWFMQAIKQRNHTLLHIMEAIVELQIRFFEEGDEFLLRPIFLRDVADKVGMDISTISRAIRHKAIQTDWNVYPLKYFFSEPIQTTSGQEVSSRIVKKRLAILIKEEDKQHPYTDEKLTEALREAGYILARRTVTKYRKQLGISVGRLRKKTFG